ncbi:MAG: long-chain fatty acid--CoA ligase [Armatimonadota bacterium]|nr:long-chain fatty acid--CoA ligase [Armatimonadota bacterium]
MSVSQTTIEPAMSTPSPVKPPATPEPCTIGQMFLQSAARFNNEPAILTKHKGAQYVPTTYAELYSKVLDVARGLMDLGLKRDDRAGILSENRPEWVFVDLACQLLGVVDVPVYPSLPTGQVEYILHDSGCRAIIVSDKAQLKKVLDAWPRLPQLGTVITMDESAAEGDSSSEDESSGDSGHSILGLPDLIERGKKSPVEERVIRQIAEEGDKDDIASIVYTSGTTGDPKGAMITQWNFLSNALSIHTLIKIKPGDLFLSFLPLNHVFERLAGYYFPLLAGSTIAYAESALRVKQNLPELQPTVMIGVPRLYDGLKDGVLAAIAKADSKQQKLFHWAASVGTRRGMATNVGKSLGLLTSIQWAIADKLILSKIRAKIGCSRIHFLVSGSAPLPRSTADFMQSVGIPFVEGYGLTETSPVTNVNYAGNIRIGSVGKAIPGVEERIAEDGEILCRGPNIMKGYLNKPEATAEAIDSEGWFHTGDIGHIDEDGYLFITDRKKDLLVLATGKKVAPQPIEGRFKASPYIKEIVVLGDHMSSCIALVVPDLHQLAEMAAEKGWTAGSEADLCALPEAKKFMRGEIDRLSAGLAEYEKIRNFALLDREFTIESGELTPTLKVKRKVVAANYADLIKSLSGS